MRKGIFWLVVVLLCLALPLAACGGQEQPPAEDTPEDTAAGDAATLATRTVTDSAGNQVIIPAEVERVAIISTLPLASVYCMLTDDVEKLVGITPSSKRAAVNSMLVEIAPGLADIYTDFASGDTVNVEAVVSLAPDVVFYNTLNQADTQAATQLTELGIACIGVNPQAEGGDTITTFAAWVTLLGEVLDEQLQAEEIVAYGREVQEMVTERVSAIPEAERKSALILGNYTESAIMAAGKPFGRYWLSAIGAVNVAAELEQPLVQVNLEQIYEWDPDVIFLNSFSAFTAADILNSTAVAGHDWSGLTAVETGEVYKMPLGVYYWFPPCSDSPLALQWLAQHLYPDYFTDLDMDATIRDYYSRFYGLELTDEQLDSIYNPPPESAY